MIAAASFSNRNIVRLFSVSVFLIALFCMVSCGPSGPKKVLVFTKTAGYKHASIPKGFTAIQKIGMEKGFEVDSTSDASWIKEEVLKEYSTVIFLNTTGNILDQYQQADFERFIQAGGGFMGIHAAADTEYEWPWYNQLVGAYFLSHPHQQQATIQVLDEAHPSTEGLRKEWSHFDEWYNYRNIAAGINVLMNLDESSYEGGENGKNHPIAWSREFDGGRMFYTGLGHTDEAYSDPTFIKHLAGGIDYVLQKKALDYAKATSLRVPLENRFDRKVLLSNLNEPMEVDYLPNDQLLFIERAGDLKLFDLRVNEGITVAHIDVDYVAEDGLLGLAVDPNYLENNWIYLFYTPKNANKLQRLSRFTLAKKELDFSSEKIMLEFPSTRECCHSGGSLEFDVNGNLYISTGDNTNPFESDGYSPSDERPGRSVWDAQKSSANTNDLRGKVIRIKPEADGTYSIPKGNLFEDDDPKTRPEIYVMGVRNAFRLSVDQKNSNVYWGDVGPDAGKSDSLRGPYGIDEINQARKPGNWGWPYTRGNNKPYWDYDFAKKQPRQPFDPNNLINDSPNNTGIQNLPPAQSSFIWYPYDASPEFSWVGKGGRTAMAGPVYRQSVFDNSAKTFPAYYEGKLFVYEWMRDWIYVVTMNEKDEFVQAERFMASSEFHNPIDMVFGKDGSLYILEYGESWNTQNLDAQLNKISYVEGNRAPIATISADRTIGAVPLTVNFFGEDSKDLEGSELKYAWDFGNGLASSNEKNPVFTFTEKGNFEVKLTVSDPQGLKAESTIKVAAGNEPPKISFTFNSENTFYNRNTPLGYQVKVSDKEDQNINVNDILVNLEFLPEGRNQVSQKVGHQIQIDIKGKQLIDGSDCKACHAVATKINGPSYQQIAAKYSDEDLPMLIGKIKNGGAGVWGATPMAAHPQLEDADITEMVKYILSLKGGMNALPNQGELNFDQHQKANLQGAYVLTASFTDKGSGDVPAITSTEQIIFKASLLEAEESSQMHPNNSRWAAEGANLIGEIRDGSYLVFDDVLFDNLSSITFRGFYSENYRYEGKIEIRLNAVDGQLVGEANISAFNQSKKGFKNTEIAVNKTLGKGKVVVVFKNAMSSENYIANADYFILNYK
jgi:cytochrome c